MENTNTKTEKVDYFKNAETKIDLEQKFSINITGYLDLIQMVKLLVSLIGWILVECKHKLKIT